MKSIRHCQSWMSRLIRRRNPEHLWVHHALALVVIMGLFAAIYTTNKKIVAHGTLTTHTLHLVNVQMTSDAALLLAAEQFVSGADTDAAGLNAAIARFQNAYSAPAQSGFLSSATQQSYFTNDAELDSNTTQYLALAKGLATQTLDAQSEALLALHAFHQTEMHAKHQTLLDHVAATGAKQAQHLVDIQRRLLAVSAIVLLAETFLIFMPAQRTFRNTIAELRQKSAVLEKSKNQLTKLNQKLEYVAHHDNLTGLPNRSSVLKHLNKVIQAKPTPAIGVLFVGIDDFKSLNDAAGHNSGDLVLQAVADRLQSCIDSEDMVARVGGDEFVLVTFEPPAIIADRLTRILAEPFYIAGRKLPLQVSIGYLGSEDSQAEEQSLIANAGIALRAAKAFGGNRIQAFTPALRHEMEAIQKLQLELPHAIESGQIEPWFQPQIRLSDGKMHGAEVLARWRHPIHGLLLPDKFLPAAVRAGLMIELDHAIWHSAMNLLQKWQCNGTVIPQISLNAAPETISDPHLMERFLFLLHLNGVSAKQIIIEVLETTIINGNDDMASINIDSLAECGIALELDDFGTGYASLSKLTQLPLSGIKLDRSLVSPLPDAAANSVVRAILALAGELNLQVVAEGIEQNEQARSLNAQGCAIGQGYGFARPMSADDFQTWLCDKAVAPSGNTAHRSAIFTWA
ncbi:EAL domain-containing protein [Yoonia sp.]|uniref:putative bifunctional diguanylate cyclase/phosphodiesterase n=1 Tax=Yoonia sp. TaxID=2212373 RepID=UPI0019E5DA7E|nr:EAL domain-containing protein [Yoonia sp.]MBE0413066.1 EAL domain-containing protein [Yoonia sp.]